MIYSEIVREVNLGVLAHLVTIARHSGYSDDMTYLDPANLAAVNSLLADEFSR